MENNEYSVGQIKVVDLRQKSLVDALSEIKERPWLWLNENNISSLKSFLNGWIVGKNCKADEQLLSDFDCFVVKKFNEETSTCGWCNIIIKHCGKEDTLVSFFNVFAEYIENARVGLT